MNYEKKSSKTLLYCILGGLAILLGAFLLYIGSSPEPLLQMSDITGDQIENGRSYQINRIIAVDVYAELESDTSDSGYIYLVLFEDKNYDLYYASFSPETFLDVRADLDEYANDETQMIGDKTISACVKAETMMSQDKDLIQFYQEACDYYDANALGEYAVKQSDMHFSMYSKNAGDYLTQAKKDQSTPLVLGIVALLAGIVLIILGIVASKKKANYIPAEEVLSAPMQMPQYPGAPAESPYTPYSTVPYTSVPNGSVPAAPIQTDLSAQTPESFIPGAPASIPEAPQQTPPENPESAE